MAVAQLVGDQKVSQVAVALCAARSTVYRWACWIREGGIEALCEVRPGRAARTVGDTLVVGWNRCSSLEYLCSQVSQFLDVVQPFPGSEHGLAKLAR